MENKEIRAFTFEVRAEQDEERGSILTGTPIVYNEPSDMGWYREIIDDGALTDTARSAINVSSVSPLL